jgi:hypothetical protein
MGLTSPNLKYIIKLKKKYNLKGPVLTFGNQDIYATEKQVISWLESEKLPVKKLKNISYSTSRTMEEINSNSKNFIHAKTFFDFLNIPEKQYFDIDKFDFDKPKILHDLEKPLPSRYYNFFRFIIDSGTLEHIFDIKSVMTNIVYATKIGGYVLQMIPAENFLNHGFYQFSPTFFYDFYTANGFDVIESYLVEIRPKIHRFYFYDQKKDYLGVYLNPNNRLANCFLVRKKANVKNIKSPDQYIYVKLSKNAKAVEKEWNKGVFNSTVALVRKIIPFKYHGLFFNLWSCFKRITSKRKYFDIEK